MSHTVQLALCLGVLTLSSAAWPKQEANSSEAATSPTVAPQQTQPTQATQVAPPAQTRQPTRIETIVYGLIPENEPVTRAAFAEVLVKVMDYPTQYIVQFPTFRDVDTSHPAYPYIEALREKRLLWATNDQGYFEPDRPIKFLEVYKTFAHLLTERNLPPNMLNHYLEGISENFRKRLNAEQKQDLAKVARWNIIDLKQEIAYHSKGNHNMYRDKLAGMLTNLVNQYRTTELVIQQRRRPAAFIPEGVTFALTPTAAIVKTTAQAGNIVYFQSTAPVTVSPTLTLDTGTRLRGEIQEEELGQQATIYIRFGQAITPEGKTYQANARLVITFPPNDKNAIVVPGNSFTVTTESIAGTAPVNTPQEEETESEATAMPTVPDSQAPSPPANTPAPAPKTPSP
jgi:hypothetical protein